MRTSSEDTKELMTVLKGRCKTLGITQEQLANKLGVSVPTLKRWFAGAGVGLEALFRLLQALDTSLSEVVGALPQVKAKTFSYTREQETFFAKKPAFLGYFDQLLQKKTPKQIERTFKISPRSTRHYLKQLEAIGLIEVYPGDRIKLLVSGEPSWRADGKLARSLRQRAIDEFVQVAANRNENLSLFLHAYCSADLSDLQHEVSALRLKAQSLHRRSLILAGETKPYGLMIGLAPFKWSVLNDVTDLTL
ncbi:MAG: helix-turn-helix transcriptional regulator [Bdellovibrionales bacterium]|nr:helix-turn-helix transcriptional regulator [Bdellovibrionales bacterium]